MTEFKKGDRVKFNAGIYTGSRKYPVKMGPNMTFHGEIIELTEVEGKPVAIVRLNPRPSVFLHAEQAVPIEELQYIGKNVR